MPPCFATHNKKAAYCCIRVAPSGDPEAKCMSKRLSYVACYDNGGKCTTAFWGQSTQGGTLAWQTPKCLQSRIVEQSSHQSIQHQYTYQAECQVKKIRGPEVRLWRVVQPECIIQCSGVFAGGVVVVIR